ncbi:hypothetical protein ES702_02618 [subsurface metagenome]
MAKKPEKEKPDKLEIEEELFNKVFMIKENLARTKAELEDMIKEVSITNIALLVNNVGRLLKNQHDIIIIFNKLINYIFRDD